MKQAYVSLVALALIFASFASPAFANGEAVAKTFTVSMKGFPDVISRGETLSGSISITLAADKNPLARRHRAHVEVFITTPLGDAPVQSFTFGIQPGTTRTVNVDIPVDKSAATGLYTMKVVVTMDGETVGVGHELTVQ